MTTIDDILTNLLVNSNYPEVKREGFVRTFYEYLIIRVLAEIEKENPELYQKMMAYFSDDTVTDLEVQEGMHQAYQDPELKEKLEKVTREVVQELLTDVTKIETEQNSSFSTLQQTG
ncbi:hypothetical protein HY024_03285 [Candidatus Curtissbacteria bacterium]|nr:hypothetical protein [Candidatus Curtissbacteria bacterium]